MWTVLILIYRYYCRAHLVEIRKRSFAGIG